MAKIKSILFAAGVLLLIGAAACLYLGLRGLAGVRPAAAYVDQGVHTFVPSAVYPVQVENHATGRDKRNHPTRTVYMVAYRATDGSGYTYRSAAGAAEQTARQIVAAGEPVTRRVLSVPQDGVSVTVEADQTAQSYVAGQRKTYGAMAGASLAYLLIWAAVHIGVAYRRRRQGRHSKRTGE